MLKNEEEIDIIDEDGDENEDEENENEDEGATNTVAQAASEFQAIMWKLCEIIKV